MSLVQTRSLFTRSTRKKCHFLRVAGINCFESQGATFEEMKRLGLWTHDSAVGVHYCNELAM